MGRLKGETGASPVLSRNCKEGFPPSQVARPKAISTTSRKRRWEPCSCVGLTLSLSYATGSFCFGIRIPRQSIGCLIVHHFTAASHGYDLFNPVRLKLCFNIDPF